MNHKEQRAKLVSALRKADLALDEVCRDGDSESIRVSQQEYQEAKETLAAFDNEYGTSGVTA